MIKRITIGWEGALASIAIFVLMPGLLAAQTPAKKPPEAPQVIDMGAYKVNAPSGEGWKTEVNKESNWVQFTKSKMGLLRQMGNKEQLTQVFVKSEFLDFFSWREAEEDVVNDIFADYARNYAKNQLFPWAKPEKKVVEWFGKKLYSMKYRENRIPGPSTESTFFLYFPPDALKSHRIFHFAYFQTLDDPTWEPIQSLVKSLEVVDPLQAVPGPHGDLLRAAAAGNTEGVIQAIEKGAGINAAGPERGAFSVAAYYGRREIVDLLLDKEAAVDIPDEKGGTTPLLAAIIGREPGIAILLAGKGAGVNRKITMGAAVGVTPLMLAVAIGHSDLTRAIIDAGADLEARTQDGEPALALAAFNGWSEGAALLLERGADANVRMNNGKTALMVAADRGHAEIAGMLLEKKADPNFTAMDGDWAGWTALMYASRRGDADIVNALIQHGADINAISKDEIWTPLALALMGEGPAINFGGLVIKQGAGQEKLKSAIALIEAGADVNLKLKDGKTVLMMASESSLTQSVRLLIDKGADVNARTNKGKTALSFAKKANNAEIVKLLQAAGAK